MCGLGGRVDVVCFVGVCVCVGGCDMVKSCLSGVLGEVGVDFCGGGCCLWFVGYDSR